MTTNGIKEEWFQVYSSPMQDRLPEVMLSHQTKHTTGNAQTREIPLEEGPFFWKFPASPAIRGRED